MKVVHLHAMQFNPVVFISADKDVHQKILDTRGQKRGNQVRCILSFNLEDLLDDTCTVTAPIRHAQHHNTVTVEAT